MKTQLKRTQEAQLRGVMGQGWAPPNLNLNSKRGGGGPTMSEPRNWNKVFGGLTVPAPGLVTRQRCSGSNRVRK